MGIGAEVGVVMLDNYELAIALQSSAAIYHFPRGGSGHRLSGLAGNIDAFAALRKSFQQFAFGWPDPTHAVIGRGGLGFRRSGSGFDALFRGWIYLGDSPE